MFDNVIGHDRQKEILQKDITQNKVSHAYAFVGPKGIGKRKLAEEFAKKLLNTNNLEVMIDYKYITRLEGKKNILIDQIRKEIVDDVHISPSAGDYKIYVIDDAENLNEESQNAILKTLEEPPKHIVIIIITDNIQTFLPTIISRVKQIGFDKLSKGNLNEYISKQESKPQFTDEMIQYIDGSIGKLVDLMQEEEYREFNDVSNIVKDMKERKELEVIKQLDKISLKNTNILDYLEYLLYYHKMYNCMIYVEKSKENLRNNANEDIVKTVLAINICRKER